jgi:hydrogenase maturation protein HypF
VRVRARVAGVVQGVGFRPYVHRLAHRHGLSGWVLNDAGGVLLEVQGAAGTVEDFLAELPGQAPPLARVSRVTSEAVPISQARGFAILESVAGAEPVALVAADAATCEDCLSELLDPADRRFRYPFINCTNCGPRFSIVKEVPYDRPRTTMAAFRMCLRCQAEYDDPADRRFHAQPNACPVCGPALRLIDADTGASGATGDDALDGAARALRDGEIVAVKGIGGYHLACRADSEAAVEALRARKRRDDKPFAVMAADLAGARSLLELSADLEQALCSPRRPIVISRRRAAADVASGVARRTAELGVMLPYTPLHHLLLRDAGVALVMTSGNRSDEPIAHRDEDALARLRPIADRLLVHDREIHVRTDDSVLRAVAPGRPAILIRRARGFVPEALELPVRASVPLLACGGDLKSAFCLAKGGSAWIGPHIGDLADLRTLRSYADGVEHFERLFGVSPALVAHDLHPDYRSTAYAMRRAGVTTLAVQHHHAHLAACLAEHRETGPVVAAIYDGTGYGPDGSVWGGELLVGDLRAFQRVGHLWPVRMPGGEQAIRQPWRMACAWLRSCAGDALGVPPVLADAVDARRWRAAAQLAGGGLGSPVTTSAGRLFDAVAALCGLRSEVSYEGQAAFELEAISDPGVADGYELPVREDSAGAVVLDARATIRGVDGDISAGVAPATVAARFHVALAEATATALSALAERHETSTVALSGGVWQNRRLLADTIERLERAGLRVLVPEALPPNDGGLAFGQAAIAAALSSPPHDGGDASGGRDRRMHR